MKINTVWIRDLDVPIKNGTVRWLNFGGKMTIEVELEVHPTVINFINTAGFFKESVRILSENNDEMAGKFTVHTGIYGILLTSDKNEVVGAEKFTPTLLCTGTFRPHSKNEYSLSNELKSNQKSILITFLTSLLEGDIKDQGNQEFIYTLVEKLKKGQTLNTFDQYLMDEIGYLMEETINDAKRFSHTVYQINSK